MCSESLLTFLEFFERVLDISPEKLGAYKPGQYLSIDYSEILILKADFWSIKPRKSGIVLAKGLCDEFTIWYVDISGKLELYLFSIIVLI